MNRCWSAVTSLPVCLSLQWNKEVYEGMALHETFETIWSELQMFEYLCQREIFNKTVQDVSTENHEFQIEHNLGSGKKSKGFKNINFDDLCKYSNNIYTD